MLCFVIENGPSILAYFPSIFSQFEEMHPPTSNLVSVERSAVSTVTENITGNAIGQQNAHDTQQAFSNTTTSEDFIGGIRRILPSEIHVSP